MLISEMSLEELQDYAKTLEDTVATQKTELEEQAGKIKEVNELNIDLQKRNLSLFKQVEQKPTSTSQEGESEPPTVTCEEFANKNYKELIK